MQPFDFAWTLLKGQRSLYDPEWDRQAYDEQGLREHEAAMAGLRKPLQIATPSKRPKQPVRPTQPRVPAQEVEGTPPGLTGTFSADYDPSAKEKDAGF